MGGFAVCSRPAQRSNPHQGCVFREEIPPEQKHPEMVMWEKSVPPPPEMAIFLFSASSICKRHKINVQ